MSKINQTAQQIADTIQSLDIKANYNLMLSLVTCIQGLSTIVQEANKLEKENSELKKALGIDDSAEQPEVKIEAVPVDEVPEGAEVIQM